MLNIEKKTKLRFKTCDGNDYSEWKEIQIGKILTERKEFSEKNKNYPHFSLTKEGVVPKSERYERDFLVKNIKKTYKITHLNDICYNPANLKFGVIAKNDLGSGIFSPIYITFTVHKEVNPTYLDLYIRYSDFIKRARRYEEGTVYERKAVQPSDFIKVKITVPCLEEQNKIAEFFSKFDELIAFYKKNLEIAQKLKKGFLQKLFPQKDNKVPELRFPGFADAWEQRKLGDVADIVGGGTPNTSIAEYWNGDINWFAPAEIGEQIYVESSNRKITKVGLDKCSAKILPIGTVLFTSRAGIGNTAILAKEACTNQGFQSIIPKEGLLDSYFIYSRSNELKKYGETVGAGSTFVEVSGKQMSKMDISLPKIHEQRKIGSYFNQLDNLITLHQRKLEILQNIKKGFFQQMFV